jgi:hypothetical protein
MLEGCATPARRAHKKARERSLVLKGLLRIRRYHQQETPYAPQEGELLSWLQFGEAYSALRGWRPIPAALLSHSVLHCSGTEDNSLPTQRLQRSWSRPTQGKTFPDKHRSIGKKSLRVKYFATSKQKSPVEISHLALILPVRRGPCVARTEKSCGSTAPKPCSRIRKYASFPCKSLIIKILFVPGVPKRTKRSGKPPQTRPNRGGRPRPKCALRG